VTPRFVGSWIAFKADTLCVTAPFLFLGSKQVFGAGNSWDFESGMFGAAASWIASKSRAGLRKENAPVFRFLFIPLPEQP
jgi:hypothetical protein